MKIVKRKRSIRPHTEEDLCLDKVYVWQWPVRLCHWLIAISIWVLSMTGIYMGHPFLTAPGEAGQHFLMGTAKLIHFYAAIVFTLAVLSRLLWMFLGNWYSRWHRFIPLTRPRWRAMAKTVRYYLFALRLPPGFIGHNPLAGLTYASLYVAFLAQIATGLGMYAMSSHIGSPVRMFAFFVPIFGGLQTAHWIHHLLMWAIWAFFVHHVYSAILMSQVEATATVESIFSGYKFVPREDLLKPGERFAGQEP